MTAGVHNRIGISTALDLIQLFWPDFAESDGCVFAQFQWSGKYTGDFIDKTQTECFINHTHILMLFRNRATFAMAEPVSAELSVREEIYDEAHPDFVAACLTGRTMARMWAIKLKHDFPTARFRVYYTQYDNPIVRFHMVRPNEPLWIDNAGLLKATDPSFRSAIIFDTDNLDAPIEKL